jgi:hypothetical protein
MANNQVVSVKPEYGVNYKEGYIGFTFDDDSFLSTGIAWFTNWERGVNPDVPNIPISHVFVVTGPDECVEAYVPKVRITKLSNYFTDPHKHIFFRKPINLDDSIAKGITDTAKSEVGKSYDYFLIIGHIISDSFIGRALDNLSKGWFRKFCSEVFDTRQGFICSELAGHSMSSQPMYKGKGVLAKPMKTIDPVELFQDRVIFTPWTIEIKGQKV